HLHVLPARALKKIDLADLAKLPGQSFQIGRANFGCPFFAAFQKNLQRLFHFAELLIARSIKKRDKLFVGHAFDLPRADQRRIAAIIANLLSEPLKVFVLRRLIGEQIGRSLDLDGADLLEFSPDGDPRRVLASRQAVQQQKPRDRRHSQITAMKYVLRNRIALTSTAIIGCEYLKQQTTS